MMNSVASASAILVVLAILFVVIVVLRHRRHRVKEKEKEKEKYEEYDLNNTGMKLDCKTMSTHILRSASMCGIHLPKTDASKLCVDGVCLTGDDIVALKQTREMMRRYRREIEGIIQDVNGVLDDALQELSDMAEARPKRFGGLVNRLENMDAERKQNMEKLRQQIHDLRVEDDE